MPYIDNCIRYKDDIISRFSASESLSGFLTRREVDELLLAQFQLADRIKWTATSNNIQPVCDIDALFKKLPWLDEKFSEVLGDYSDHHSGNFYITTQLHDAHADLLTADECSNPSFEWTHTVVPYKSVVIPLLLTEGGDAHTAFFRQRHIGHSITLDKAGVSKQSDSMYQIARHYPDFITHGQIYTGDEYLMPQIPEENLSGMDIETILQFNIGDVMLFDSCQIHASCVSTHSPNYKWLKSGINIQFYKEI